MNGIPPCERSRSDHKNCAGVSPEYILCSRVGAGGVGQVFVPGALVRVRLSPFPVSVAVWVSIPAAPTPFSYAVRL